LNQKRSDQDWDQRRRDADVALPPSRNPGDTLVGRRIASVAVALYRSRNAFDPLTEAPCVSGYDALAHTDPVKWMETEDAGRIVMRTYTMAGQRYAVCADIGIGALPCFAADPDPSLVRVTEPLHDMENELWLLTHPDLRNTGRIRVLMDFLAADPDLLEGTQPGP
tara:strand:- start:542 stop:1039 length:498 start_codon:yes stop_codon:yes gene_type:complete